jgi:hypothetical protein
MRAEASAVQSFLNDGRIEVFFIEMEDGFAALL